jgi:two-component system chemotaxis sensor kinase CheA
MGAHAGVLATAEQLSGAKSQEKEVSESREGETGEKMSLLLFRSGVSAMKGVPLSLVARLEEFPQSKIENADGRLLVQYRNSLLPLVPCEEILLKEKKDPQAVIVFSDGDRSMGLMVEEIRDIVEERMTVESSSGKKGILGAAIISGKATEIIDIYHFLASAYPDWFSGVKKNGRGKAKRILLVDDSAFFREMLRPVLESAGYQVVISEDGVQAVSRFERGEEFDLVLSDIDMPNMNGYELAKKLREDFKLSHLPLISLSALSSDAERQKGLDAGFDQYLVKFDRDAVLQTLRESIGGVRQKK